MRLLTVENAKTIKGEKLGYLTGILYLAPANESGVMNTCQFATDGCKASCLYTAGRAAIFATVNSARVRKTRWLASDRNGFIAQLRRDIVSLVRAAKRQRVKPAIRINGTSDLAWLSMQMAAEFPTVQFYDYTKLTRPWQRARENYSLTFSMSESNQNDCLDALSHGINVAMVFAVKRGEPLPEMWGRWHVIDGDAHDLRFLDTYRSPVIIGLRAKGRAKKDSSGFVRVQQIAMAAAGGAL